MLRNKLQIPKLTIHNSQLKTPNSQLKTQDSQLTTHKLWSLVICVLILFCHLCFGICHLSFADEKFVYDAKDKRNPFIPLISPDGRFLKLEADEIKKDAELKLEGIIYHRHGFSYAIVNNNVVKIGDFVDDYQVLKIEQGKVTFIKEGKINEMELILTPDDTSLVVRGE